MQSVFSKMAFEKLMKVVINCSVKKPRTKRKNLFFKNIQSTTIMKLIDSHSNTDTSFLTSAVIVKQRRYFSDEESIKEAWLKCAPVIFKRF